MRDFDRVNNILVSQETQVSLTPPPNLVVNKIVALDSTFSGQFINVKWSVINIGLGITKSDTWTDCVYLIDEKGLRESLGGFSRAGRLAIGSFYEQEQKFRISEDKMGNYEIRVVTNCDKGVFEYLDYNDNEASRNLSVILSPPANLELTSIELSSHKTSFVSGDTLNITFIVTNVGFSKTLVNSWLDQVVLRSSSTQILIYSGAHWGVLNPEEFYMVTRIYQIPSDLSTDSYTIEANTDSYGAVFEYPSVSRENNQKSLELNITQELPDLESHIFYTLSEYNDKGNWLIVNYTVRNIGKGKQLQQRLDSILIYSSFHDVSQTQYENQARLLKNGETQNCSFVILLDKRIFGSNIRVKVYADSLNVLKETNKSNNIFDAQINYEIPKALPKLVVINLSLSDLVLKYGFTYTLNWKVVNQGNMEMIETWSDEVYLSQNETIPQSGSLRLTGLGYKSSLKINESYIESAKITIPKGLNGIREAFIIVRPSTEYGVEHVVKVSLQATGQPDLAPFALSYEIANSLRSLYVNYSVRNYGIDMMQASFWKDRIYLNSSYVNIPIEQKLNYLGEYSVRRAVLSLPENLNGLYSLKVEIRNDQDSDPSNNILILSSLINLKSAVKNIVILEYTLISEIPDSLFGGGVYNSTFEIKTNTDLQISIWSEKIYLFPEDSSDIKQVVDYGVLVSSIENYASLKISQTMRQTHLIQIPFDLEQDKMYLYLVADYEKYAMNNPVMEKLKIVKIQRGQRPDLVVSMVTLDNFEVTGGMSLKVNYSVMNIGEGSTGYQIWFDGIFLSSDPRLDPYDLRLSTIKNQHPLLPNGSYTNKESVELPFDLPSQLYYIIVKTAVSSTLPETNLLNNVNFAVFHYAISSSIDLSVENFTVTQQGENYGEKVSFNYMLTNRGMKDADLFRCDSIYLSKDQVWDFKDVQLDKSDCKMDHFSSSSSIAVEKVEVIPFIKAGTYFGLAKTRLASDPILSNNEAAAPQKIEIKAPIIQVGQTLKINLLPGQSAQYELQNVPPDETIIIKLETIAQAYHRLFARYNESATLSEFDHLSSPAQSENQTLVISNSKRGSYYLRVSSLAGNEVAPYDINLSARVSVFEVIDVYPQKISSIGRSTLTIVGAKIPKSIEACLVKDEFQLVVCTNRTTWVSSEMVYVEFNLNQTIGIYDLLLRDLRKINKNETRLKSGVHLIQGSPGSLRFEIKSGRALLSNEIGETVVIIENTGFTDALAPVLFLSTNNPSVNFRIIEDKLNQDWKKSYLFVGISNLGLAGRFPPQSRTQFTLQIRQNGVGQVSFNLKEFNVTDPFLYFLSQADGIEWADQLKQNFRDLIGRDSTRYKRNLVRAVERLSMVGVRVFSVKDLNAWRWKIANNQFLNEMHAFSDIITGESESILTKRTYKSAISKRRSKGKLGLGWGMSFLSTRIVNLTDEFVDLEFDTDLFRCKFIQLDKFKKCKLDNELTVVLKNYTFFLFNEVSGMVFSFSSVTLKLEKILNLENGNLIAWVSYDKELIGTLKFPRSDRQIKVIYSQECPELVGSLQLYNSASTNIETIYYKYSNDCRFLLLTQKTPGDETVKFTYTDNNDLESVIYLTKGLKIQHTYNTRNRFLENTQTFLGNVALTSQSVDYFDVGAVRLRDELRNSSYLEVQFDLVGRSANRNGENADIRSKVDDKGRIQILLDDRVILTHSVDLARNTRTSTDLTGTSVSFEIEPNTQNIKKYKDKNDNEFRFNYSNANSFDFFYPDNLYESFEFEKSEEKPLRLKRKKLRDGSEMTFKYYSDGLASGITIKSSDGGMVEEEYFYDDWDNLVGIGSDGKTKAQVEYLAGKKDVPVKVKFINGEQLSYEYNSLGQRVKISGNSGYLTMLEYNNRAQLSAIKDGNDLVIAEFVYDLKNRLVRQKCSNGIHTKFEYQDGKFSDQIKKIIFLNGSQVFDEIEIVIDEKGARKSIISKFEGVQEFKYDELGQLVEWLDAKVEYDRSGNRKKFTDNSTAYDYNVNNLNQFIDIADQIYR